MISTENYSSLPVRDKLKDFCKRISVLDAILSEDWLGRYYTYNSRWAESEELGSMTNEEGDKLLILFRKDGCAINGMTHAYYPRDKAKLTVGLPKIYDEFLFGEPVHSIGTTFCIWTNNQNKWQIGELENTDDGSEELLSIFDGNPRTYIDYATVYYENRFSVNENTLKVVTEIYQGQPLTKSMVLTINRGFDHWQQLREDLLEIDYPDEIA